MILATAPDAKAISALAGGLSAIRLPRPTEASSDDLTHCGCRQALEAWNLSSSQLFTNFYLDFTPWRSRAAKLIRETKELTR